MNNNEELKDFSNIDVKELFDTFKENCLIFYYLIDAYELEDVKKASNIEELIDVLYNTCEKLKTIDGYHDKIIKRVNLKEKIGFLADNFEDECAYLSLSVDDYNIDKIEELSNIIDKLTDKINEAKGKYTKKET